MDEKHKNELFRYYDHLGTDYPYYLEENSRLIISKNIENIINEIPQTQRTIDSAGIIEIISNSFLLSNRTLVNGVKRAPWMGKISDSGIWEYSEIPNHSNSNLDIEQAAKVLKLHLKNEMLKYIDKRNTIGILLSGGLDSRIVAGVLRELQLSNEFKGDVVALTWGVTESRDVIYASEICKKYNWEWNHLKLDAEVLEANIYTAAKIGAEFSPLHLHAMSQVREVKGIDAIIAGSYGDSVGRAEYSGRHLLRVKETLPGNLNKFGLLKSEVIRSNYSSILDDAYGYKKYIKRTQEYQYREIEQEMHYMRRKLQACMNYISEKTPVYQLFTDPKTFGFMWGLDPTVRNDKIYEIILKGLPDEVGSMPWARTGRSLNSTVIDNNTTLKTHHKYGLWLRNDLNNFITKLVTSDRILNLGIFNEKALLKLIKIWPKSSTITTNQIDEIISWLASLSLFLEKYNINNSFTPPTNFRDKLNSFYGISYAKVYQMAREKQRK
ncbi:asparagine synthase-related protein [Bacillus fonticola]|uniref:asparagine synthase-related protein n=1 Tax=Bacillus fonticola TaxID=2728853 RepID=UPI001D151DD7|nr:asparagine synthase-related protein [Bacillus fonticola]